MAAPGAIAAAANLLRDAARVVALTGAGVSAESGVPTFRGAGGLWRNHSAMELATAAAFLRDPLLSWQFYQDRREKLRDIQPNAGHFTLAEMERAGRDFLLVTQNVDGLHGLAGSTQLVELHGNIWVDRCVGCGRETRSDGTPRALPPRCGSCGALLRPGVVWFGEALPEAAWQAAAEAVADCDILLVIGTSAVVYPAAGLVPAARTAGAAVVEINIEPTPAAASADVCCYGPSAQLLPEIWAAARGEAAG